MIDRSNRARGPRRQEPRAARADARARRRRAPRRVERDPLVPRATARSTCPTDRSTAPACSSGCSSSSTSSSRTIAVARFWIALLGAAGRVRRPSSRRSGAAATARSARSRGISPAATGSSATRYSIADISIYALHARRRARAASTSRSTRRVQAWIDRVAGRPGLRPDRRLARTRPWRRSRVAQLRRYVVAHQGYATRFRRARAADVAATVRRLGCVQLDSISTVDRAHRLTLTSRIGALPRARGLAAARARAGSSSTGRTRPASSRSRTTRSSSGGWCTCSEQHWWGRKHDHDPKVKERVLDALREHGPLPTRFFEGGGGGGMWNWKPEKRILEDLFAAGEVVVAGRDGLPAALRPARARDPARSTWTRRRRREEEFGAATRCARCRAAAR